MDDMQSPTAKLLESLSTQRLEQRLDVGEGPGEKPGWMYAGKNGSVIELPMEKTVRG